MSVIAHDQMVEQPGRHSSGLRVVAHLEGMHLRLPRPLLVLRNAWPIVLEAVVAPLVLFYVVVSFLGLKAAVGAALAWSCVALVRRVKRGERVSTMLGLGVGLLILRSVVVFVTGSAFIYFAQPLIGTALIALCLIGSAVIGRPFTQRFAQDFCPIDSEFLARPNVQRFFIRISVMWAAVLLFNVGFVFWLLRFDSLKSFVLERAAVTYGLTAMAIFFSITRFIAMMRADGVHVAWDKREPAFQPVEV